MLSEIADVVSCVSFKTVALALRRPAQLRRYVSYCLKIYDEFADKGLPARSPVTPEQEATITLPAYHSGGGMSFAELMILARTTKTRCPKTIFEMGTYNGLTTAVFILNSAPDAVVITLDLPPIPELPSKHLSSDKDLISNRRLGSVPSALGLTRYTQLLSDSMTFDASPYSDSVDLGLVDAAHDRLHVKNDTEKMARMIKEDGLVFWHDYGGRGALRPLASYFGGSCCGMSDISRFRDQPGMGAARGLKAALAKRTGLAFPHSAPFTLANHKSA